MEGLPSGEARAVRSVVEKLKVQGLNLPFPHQSAVRGAESGMRELRPRAGRSRTRVIYAAISERRFALLALAPEAQVDSRGFAKAVRLSEVRLSNCQRSD